uniref:Uncharacterized protein n=1 Tax=Cacopsylla melanoneura TaxID=428564 RepID=A0A8D9DRX0_9HEMI
MTSPLPSPDHQHQVFLLDRMLLTFLGNPSLATLQDSLLATILTTMQHLPLRKVMKKNTHPACQNVSFQHQPRTHQLNPTMLASSRNHLLQHPKSCLDVLFSSSFASHLST